MKKVTTVEEYLADVPKPQRSTLEKTLAMIRAAVPKEATEAIGVEKAGKGPAKACRSLLAGIGVQHFSALVWRNA